MPANEENRQDARDSDFRWMKDARHIACYRGVWNSVRAPTRNFEERYEVSVEKDRNGDCFVLEYRPEMELSAAEELERRKRERKKFRSRTRMLVARVFVALLGVLKNAVIQLINLYHSTPSTPETGG